jgi:prolyl oligopeptidase
MTLRPPPPTRREAVVDVLHGVEVPDPYRWLEAGEATEVAAWVAAQNERTAEALGARPDREGWHRRLVAFLSAPVSAGVRVQGDRVFTLERAGGAPQARLVVRSLARPADPPRVLLDPAALSDDATSAIDWYHPSPDGSLVAYGVSDGGDERSTLRVLSVDDGTIGPDEIPDTRAASVGWLPDGSGFLYTRYPAGDEYHRMVYEHRLGADPADDRLVFGDLPTPESWPDVWVSPDGRHVLVHLMVGWQRVDVHLLDRAAGTWTEVVAGHEAVTSLTVHDGRLVGTTTLHSPRGRVVTASLDSPSQWDTVVPEPHDGVIDGVVPTAEQLLVLRSRHAVSALHRHSLDGSFLGEVTLPGLVTVTGVDALRTAASGAVQLEGFTRPPSLYRWAGDDRLDPWSGGGLEGPAGPALPEMVVERVTYPSLDGTEVGLFLVHRADVTPGPGTPCILTGYGGFAVALPPAWNPVAATWCEAGGLWAVAGLRGGTEEGEDWHTAGRREHKQHVFEDFEAAARFLVGTGRTSVDRLAVRGGSNGGLLVGAFLTREPALARAVHCAVPLLDMVRFPQFLIARLWTDEYGDPDVAEEFGWLWSYSPYHQVRPGLTYPAVLLTAGEGDGRVDPCHARKMAAALQHAAAGQDQRPVLLRQEGRAGHGQGKPLAKQADEAADVLTFLAWQLGGPTPPP